MAIPTLPHTPIQDHKLFHAVLGQVTTCARLKLPDSVARIERALQILYHNGVTLLADGTALVQSQTDPDVEYQVNGTCPCHDAQYAPDNVCKHLAASWIYRRVQQRLVALDATETGLALEECPVVLDEDGVPCHAVNNPCPHETPVPSIPRQFVVELHGKSFVTYAGLLAMAHAQHLVELAAEITVLVPGEIAIAKATAIFEDGRAFTESADATPGNVSGMVKPHFIRMALTRAKARCLRDALNINLCSVEELD